MTHIMKSWPWLFQAIKDGTKLHDIRGNDRRFQVGDWCLLQEFDPCTGVYTGRELNVIITYITSNMTPCALSSAVLHHDYAVLSYKLV